MRPESGFRIARNRSQIGKMSYVTNFQHDVIVNFFWHCFVSLVKFCYWSKFHVNIIVGSGVMTIFFYNGLSRNPKIRNTLIWVLPNIWRLGQVRDTKFDTNVSNKMLLDAAKYQGFFYHYIEIPSFFKRFLS